MSSATPMAALRLSVCNLLSMSDIRSSADLQGTLAALKKKGLVSYPLGILLTNLDRAADQGLRSYEENFAIACVTEAQEPETCWVGLKTLIDTVTHLKGKCDFNTLKAAGEENGLGLTDADCRDILRHYEERRKSLAP